VAAIISKGAKATQQERKMAAQLTTMDIGLEDIRKPEVKRNVLCSRIGLALA